MMVIQHCILLVSTDIFQLLIIFAHVMLIWKHGTLVTVCQFILMVHFSEGKDGTPLACAASKGRVKIVNCLLGQNVDVNGSAKVFAKRVAKP